MNLVDASNSGNLEEVKRLLRDDPKSHEYKDSAFVWACYRGHVEIVKLLLEHGADVNVIGRLLVGDGPGSIFLKKYLLLEKLNAIDKVN